MIERLVARALVVLGLATMSMVGTACTDPHLSPNFGRSYNTWLAAQHVNQKYQNPAAARPFIEGLDAAEAAVVTKNYRTTTTKSADGTAGQSRILMVAPQRSGNEGYMPPPSVPGGQ
jgi:hypothetical protein